jgi:hypothetical protein
MGPQGDHGPLFFPLMQLAIAVALFTISNILNLLPERLTLDPNICKGLIPMVRLNVLSLRSVDALVMSYSLICAQSEQFHFGIR